MLPRQLPQLRDVTSAQRRPQSVVDLVEGVRETAARAIKDEKPETCAAVDPTQGDCKGDIKPNRKRDVKG